MGYKSAEARPATARVMVWAVATLAVFAAGVAVGCAVAPQGPTTGTAAVPPSGGVRIVDGVPTGFARTPRGAAEAAAAYETARAASVAKPRQELRRMLEQLVAAEVRADVVEQLMPSQAVEGNGNISQLLVARVWAERASDAEVATGTQITVKLYSFVLRGARTDGRNAGPKDGLAGSAYVQTIVMQLDADRWRIRVVAAPALVPPPDLRGTTRDGSPRDTQPLVEVLGPDSWVPGTS